MFLKNPKNILLARAKAAIFYTTKEKKEKKKQKLFYSGIALLAQCESSAKFRMTEFFAQTVSIS